MNTFFYHQDYEQVTFYRKSRLQFIGPSLRDGKVTTHLQLPQNWHLSTRIWKIYFFYQNSQPINDVMQREIESLEFVQRVNFEFMDSLRNNGKKYLLIFDDSFEEICISNAFVDIATAWRHCDWALLTLNTTFFVNANLSETLSSKTRTFFSSNLPVTRCKSARLVDSWVSDQS